MPFERAVSSWLNRYPRLKGILRSIYVRCFSLLAFWKRKNLSSVYRFRKIGTVNSFFGYYDFSPVRNGRTLYHRTRQNISEPVTTETKLQVVIEDAQGKELFAEETSCFNWQQGARANWFNDSQIVFNTINDFLQKVTRIVDVDSGRRCDIIGYHYQCHDNQFFYFLNYHLIGKMRPDYGYFNEVSSDSHVVDERLEGIHFSSIDDPGKVELLVSLVELRKALKVPEKARVKINHVMPNSTATDLIFICRIFEGGKRSGCLARYCHKDGSLSALTKFGTVSHMTWADEETVFGYFESSEFGITYQALNLVSLELIDYSWIKSVTNGDGHPTFLNSTTIVTDTYPDRYRNQSLYKFDLNSKSSEIILTNYHPIKYSGERRCDFHPRKIDENTVAIDTIVDDARRLVIVSLGDG